MLFAVLFMFSTIDHPDRMQALTNATWATLAACEAVLDNESIKFAQHMDALQIQMVDATSECVVDPRGGRGV